MSWLQTAMLVFEMSWSYKVSRWGLVQRHAVYGSQNSLILRLSQTILELCSRCVSEYMAQVEFYASLNRVYARSTVYVQRSPAEIHTAVQRNLCGRSMTAPPRVLSPCPAVLFRNLPIIAVSFPKGKLR